MRETNCHNIIVYMVYLFYNKAVRLASGQRYYLTP